VIQVFPQQAEGEISLLVGGQRRVGVADVLRARTVIHHKKKNRARPGCERRGISVTAAVLIIQIERGRAGQRARGCCVGQVSRGGNRVADPSGSVGADGLGIDRGTLDTARRHDQKRERPGWKRRGISVTATVLIMKV
jgi:hypothetical protein